MDDVITMQLMAIKNVVISNLEIIKMGIMNKIIRKAEKVGDVRNYFNNLKREIVRIKLNVVKEIYLETH